MNSRWLLCYCITLLTCHSTSAQSVSISLSSSSPILNVENTWTVTGSLTLTPAHTDSYQRNIYIKSPTDATTKAFCFFPHADCSSSRLPDTPVNDCQCTGRVGDVYSFIIRQQGHLADSEKILQAYLPSSSLLGAALTSSTLTLPLMYKATASSESKTQSLTSGSTLEVSSGDSVKVSVELPGSYRTSYTLTITVSSGQTNTSTDGIVTVTPPDGGSTGTFTLTTGGKNDTFTFEMVAQVAERSTGATPGVSSTSTIYIPDIPGTTGVEPAYTTALQGHMDKDINKTDTSFSKGLIPSALVPFLSVTSVIFLL